MSTTRSSSRTQSSTLTDSPANKPSALGLPLSKTGKRDEHSWMDDKLRQQSEFIITLLSKKLEDTEKRITEELGREIKDIKNSLNDINKRVEQLEACNVDVQSNICSLNNELKHLKTSLANVTTECTNTKLSLKHHSDEITNISNNCDHVVDDIINLKQTLNTYENQIIACDAFIFGIPFMSNENLKSLFNLICDTINIKPPTLNNIYRTRPKKNSLNSAIKIKFNSPFDKNYVLTSIAKHRKINNKQLCLADIHFTTDNPSASSSSIYIRESLTQRNKAIMQHALELRRCKKLSSVFSTRGVVYVKREPNDTAIPIDCIEGLEDVARTTSN